MLKMVTYVEILILCFSQAFKMITVEHDMKPPTKIHGFKLIGKEHLTPQLALKSTITGNSWDKLTRKSVLEECVSKHPEMYLTSLENTSLISNEICLHFLLLPRISKHPFIHCEVNEWKWMYLTSEIQLILCSKSDNALNEI